MNFYDSQSLVWPIGRFFGLYYFKNHQNELKITNYSVILALIPGVCFLLLAIIGILNLVPDEGDMEVFGIGFIFLLVSRIGIVVQLMNCVVIFTMSFVHRNGVLMFYQNINELDGILINKLKIKLNYKKMKIRSSVRLASLEIGFIIISFIIDYVSATNKSYILIVLLYNFTAGSGLTSAYEYIHCTKMIKCRLESLNVVLRTERINSKNLEIMIKCHFTLHRLIIKMNKIYGLRQLSSITNDFVIILVQLYSYFVSIENGWQFVYVKYLIGSLMLPYLMAKLFFMSTCCQQVLSNKKKFGNLLKKLENLKTVDEEISSLVYLLLFWIWIIFLKHFF